MWPGGLVLAWLFRIHEPEQVVLVLDMLKP